MGAQLEELSEVLASADTGPPDVEKVVRFAARVVAHSDFAGLTLIRGARPPVTVAATGRVVHQVDSLQYEVDEGPCLDAIAHDDVIVAADLRASTQWPDFGRRCVTETRILSMVSVRLSLSGSNRASLNFYAFRPTAFEDLDLRVAVMFAPFVALAVQSELQSEEIEQLTAALHGNRLIGTAVGILMAKQLVTSEEAFAQLVQASQHSNRKLRDIAGDVEATGRLPGPGAEESVGWPGGRASSRPGLGER